MINDYKFYIKEQAYNDIIKFLVNKEPEQGGIIGCSGAGIICDFHYDRNPKSSTVSSYIPNVRKLNAVINSEWKQRGVSFTGFVHTHINSEELSPEDITYAREVLLSISDCKYVIMGIVVLDKLYSLNKVLWYLINEKECVKIEIAK